MSQKQPNFLDNKTMTRTSPTRPEELISEKKFRLPIVHVGRRWGKTSPGALRSLLKLLQQKEGFGE
jgi:hypothetical protein